MDLIELAQDRDQRRALVSYFVETPQGAILNLFAYSVKGKMIPVLLR
jgi:hypothetical protein